MSNTGETTREVMIKVTQKAWTDPEYRKQLQSNPKGTLEREGLDMGGKDVSVHVHLESDSERHIVIRNPPKSIDFGEEDIVRYAAERLQIVTDP